MAKSLERIQVVQPNNKVLRLSFAYLRCARGSVLRCRRYILLGFGQSAGLLALESQGAETHPHVSHVHCVCQAHNFETIHLIIDALCTNFAQFNCGCNAKLSITAVLCKHIPAAFFQEQIFQNSQLVSKRQVQSHLETSSRVEGTKKHVSGDCATRSTPKLEQRVAQAGKKVPVKSHFLRPLVWKRKV